MEVLWSIHEVLVPDCLRALGFGGIVVVGVSGFIVLLRLWHKQCTA